jgi:hypothetical protein
MSAIQHARSARAHEEAAARHEAAAMDKYEQQMRAAGAEMHAAIALLAAEVGLKTPPSDARGYEGYMKGKAGKVLAQPIGTLLANLNADRKDVKGAAKDREWAKRITQWHTDPASAGARRIMQIATDAKLRLDTKQKNEKTRVREYPSAPRYEAAAGNQLAFRTQNDEAPRAPLSREAQVREQIGTLLGRIRTAVAAVSAIKPLEDAADVLQSVADDLEGAA